VATASIHLAWSPNGRYLAAGNLDRTLGIWDFQDPADPWILQGCPGKIRQLVWSINPHSHNPLLAVATGTDIVLWQLAQADPSLGWEGELLTGHQAPVSAIAIHPHHLALAAADLDGYVCLWTPTGVVLQILEGTNTFSGFTTLAWNSEGSCLATGDGNGQLVVWCVSE
jgi:WD40 repeat protein